VTQGVWVYGREALVTHLGGGNLSRGGDMYMAHRKGVWCSASCSWPCPLQGAPRGGVAAAVRAHGVPCCAWSPCMVATWSGAAGRAWGLGSDATWEPCFMTISCKCRLLKHDVTAVHVQPPAAWPP
jgi:hypothetical protein